MLVTGCQTLVNIGDIGIPWKRRVKGYLKYELNKTTGMA